MVGLACEVGIAFTTVLPGAPYVPQWPEFALLPFTFLAFGFAIFTRRVGYGRGLPSMSIWARTAFAAPVVATIAGFASAVINLPGQPERRGSHYFLNDHGNFIPVSHSGYERALLYQQRILTLIPSVFFAIAALALSGPRQAASTQHSSKARESI